MIGLVKLGEDSGAVMALAGALALGGKLVLGMIRTVRRLGRLADEVLGDGGHRPGWGSRIAAIEQDVSTLKTKVTQTLAEVKPNGGSSMKDQISRIEHATGATRDEETP